MAEQVRRRGPQDLQLAQDHHLDLFDRAPVGLAELDHDGRVMLANRTLAELVGCSSAELRGRPFADLVHPDHRDLFVARFPAFFRRPRGKSPEMRLLTTGAHPRTVRLAARGVGGGSGAEGSLLVSVHDVTVHGEVETRSSRLDEQMRQAQKLESFSLFAGGIARDFNSILMSVVGHCDLAHWEMPAGHVSRGHLEMALKSAGHAADVCRQLLTYAGQGKQELEALDLGRLTRDLLPILRVSVGPRIRIELDAHVDPVLVQGDRHEVQQAVTNLVTNAAEAYGGTAGVVRVKVGRHAFTADELADGATPHPPAAGTLAAITVSDEGAGMDAATRERIFDPFFSTKFSGRGLGMAAVLGIVRGHGGTILMHTAPGRGTTATVALPLHEDTVGGATVLLIDDDERVRLVGENMLTALGLVPLVAADGPSGIEIYRRRHHQIACVMLDLMMPSMDGVEVLTELRAIDPQCRVVIITGFHGHDVATGLGATSPDAVILKPFRLGDLRNVLATLLSA